MLTPSGFRLSVVPSVSFLEDDVIVVRYIYIYKCSNKP